MNDNVRCINEWVRCWQWFWREWLRQEIVNECSKVSDYNHNHMLFLLLSTLKLLVYACFSMLLKPWVIYTYQFCIVDLCEQWKCSSFLFFPSTFIYLSYVLYIWECLAERQAVMNVRWVESSLPKNQCLPGMFQPLMSSGGLTVILCLVHLCYMRTNGTCISQHLTSQRHRAMFIKRFRVTELFGFSANHTACEKCS